MLIESSNLRNEIEKEYSITVKCDMERTVIATSDSKDDLGAIWNLLKSTGFFSSGKKITVSGDKLINQDDIIKAPDSFI